jgi:hypothetical protein
MGLNPKNYLDTRRGFGNQVVQAQLEGVGRDMPVVSYHTYRVVCCKLVTKNSNGLVVVVGFIQTLCTYTYLLCEYRCWVVIRNKYRPRSISARFFRFHKQCSQNNSKDPSLVFYPQFSK